MPFCDKCDHHFFKNDGHSCPPIWIICCDTYGWDYDGCEVYGRDPEYVVEKWAERHDGEGDYDIVNGSDRIVAVRKKGEPFAASQWIHVSGEVRPHYSAQEVDDGDADQEQQQAEKEREVVS